MQNLSLLWPEGMDAETPGVISRLPEDSIRDLGLAATVEMISPVTD